MMCLADEWPNIISPDVFDEYGYDGVIEPGMVLSVESFIGSENGHEGVKLEQMVLIGETGSRVLSTYPFEALLLA